MKRKRAALVGLTYPPLPLEPPAALSGEGRKLWEEIVPHLIEAATHTVVDEPLLVAYCQAFAEWEAYQHFANAIGLQRAAQLGTYRVAHQLLRTVIRLSDRLGLNPLARRKIRRRMAGKR